MRMNRYLVLSVCLILLSLGLGSYWFWPLPEPVYPVQRLISYGYTLSNRQATPVKDVVFTTYAPLAKTPGQHRLSLSANYEFKEITDKDGNHLIEFHFDYIPPYSSRIIELKSMLAFAQEPNYSEQPQSPEHLQSQYLIESDNMLIVEKAIAIKASHSATSVENIYRWVNQNMTSVNHLSDNLGATYAIRNQKGDCTEFATLSAALARANNLPSRVLEGYMLSQSGRLNPIAFHNWAEIYADKHWYLVDAQESVFNKNFHHYVAMRIWTHNEAELKVKRFKIVGNGIQVTMNS